MNTHIDTIAQWYASAERITNTNLPCAGDTLIFPYNADGYAIEAEEDDWTPDDVVPGEPVRILARAPKPEPAWHDAVAVLANHRDYPDEERTVWTRELDPEQYDWADANGQFVAPHHLVNVTPLIEAKVTDEMIERASHAVVNWTYSPRPETTICLDLGDKGSRALVGTILTAALGLEAE